ncbi:MAG: hypothetical protein K2Q06_16620 [Parvularculaceae bacterium]|nr:hypothetical protein [Parvularculaceae bacterium]
MDALRISTGVVAVKASDAGEKLQTEKRELDAQQRAPAELTAQQADRLERTQQLVSEIVGANTRVQVDRRQDAPGFQYRAVDVETGEVIAEWPFVAESGEPETGRSLVDRRV